MQHGSSSSFATGVPPIDRILGGTPEGRILLVGGPTGAGKSAACLQFVREGLHRGETSLLLTQHRIGDVRSHAQRVGIDLRSAVREQRVVLVRFAPSFAERVALGAAPASVVEELRKTIEAARPARIAIDTVSPFLAGGSRAAARAEALAEYLDSTGATCLLTWSGESASSASLDRAMEPLVHRAAAILHLSREPRGKFRLEHVNARFVPPDALGACYTVGSGCLECVPDDVPAPATRPASRRDGPVVILHAHDAVDEDLRALVAREFHVRALAASTRAVPEDAGAILIETSHATLGPATATLRGLVQRAGSSPLIIVSRYALRSLDRARLLRAGADECLVYETGAAEFFARLSSAIARGRGPAPGPEALASSDGRHDPGSARADSRGAMLARAAFARALAEHVTRDDPVQYSVVSLATAPEEPDVLPELAELASRTMRSLSGDLVTTHDDRVLVYLHGARQRDGAAFLERVRQRWTAMGHRPLRVETLTYPADEPRMRHLIATGRTS